MKNVAVVASAVVRLLLMVAEGIYALVNPLPPSICAPFKGYLKLNLYDQRELSSVVISDSRRYALYFVLLFHFKSIQVRIRKKSDAPDNRVIIIIIIMGGSYIAHFTNVSMRFTDQWRTFAGCISTCTSTRTSINQLSHT
jgi:hypothetical protein